MTSESARGEGTPSPSPETENPALVRVLKIAVIGMGIMILAGLAAVVWRIVHLSSSPKVSPPAASVVHSGAASSVANLALELPDGASVRSISLAGSRLAVHYEAPSGAGIAIVDTKSGRTLARVRFGAGRP